MPKLSDKSKKLLLECHPDLQRVINRAIEITDLSVICGHRDKAAQDKAVAEGKSNAPYPKS